MPCAKNHKAPLYSMALYLLTITYKNNIVYCDKELKLLTY